MIFFDNCNIICSVVWIAGLSSLVNIWSDFKSVAKGRNQPSFYILFVILYFFLRFFFLIFSIFCKLSTNAYVIRGAIFGADP